MLKQLAEREMLFGLTQFSIYTVEVANYEAVPTMRVRQSYGREGGTIFLLAYTFKLVTLDYLCLLVFLLPVTAGGVLTSLDIFSGLEFWAHKLIGISCALALAYPAWVCIQKFKPKPKTT